jgi:hypothetical protein
MALLKAALEADDIVVGGGNAKRLEDLPPGARMVDNANAFIGGFRLWDKRQSNGVRRAPQATG